MSALSSALIVTLVGALASTSSSFGPPALPPEPPPPEARQDAPAPEGQQGDGQQTEQPAPPGPVRDTLPPGLQPVPFPLENQRPPTNEPLQSTAPPPPERRSVVDLRDPFNRPPPRPRPASEHESTGRLLMPDLKDPFAPGARRVRSKTLDRHVPNDIRDPFRTPPRPDGRPLCAKTTADGTVVQGPNNQPPKRQDCEPPPLDLRDPFDRNPDR